MDPVDGVRGQRMSRRVDEARAETSGAHVRNNVPFLQIGIPARADDDPEIVFQPPLKVVFFDFDGTITNDLPLFARTMAPGTVSKMELGRLMDKDGSGGRVEMLWQFFNALRERRVLMYVLTTGPAENVVDALRRLELLQFFRDDEAEGGVDTVGNVGNVGNVGDVGDVGDVASFRVASIASVDGTPAATMKARFVDAELKRLQIAPEHARVVDEDDVVLRVMREERVAPGYKVQRGGLSETDVVEILNR